jgi:FOG: WD40 repeat
LAITKDNKFIVSGSYDNTVNVWNFLEKRLEYVIKEHSSSVYCVAVSFYNRYIASCGADKTIRI